MTVKELERTISEFASFVMNLLERAGLPATNLHILWEDLQYERRDPWMVRIRWREALLGCDPDELDPEEIKRRMEGTEVPDAPSKGR